MLWIPALLGLLSVLQSGGADSHPQCKTSKLKIVLKCHHNDSGTWQSQVVVSQDAKDSEGDKNPWRVDLDQVSHVCEKGQSTLETTISLESPGVVSTTNKEDEANVELLKTIPPGYELFPGVGYYKFHNEVAKWPAAQDKCAQEGGHLVIINSEAEREVIKKLSERNPKSAGSSNPDQIHTGLKRTDAGKHVTIFGVPLEKTGFSTWYTGQPSSGAAEPCVSIMRSTIELNDISCEKQILAFICEKGDTSTLEAVNTKTEELTTIPTAATIKPIEGMPETTPVPSKTVPPGYELFTGVGYYKYHHGVSKWSAARDRCAQEGGHLVIINSEKEREVVRKLSGRNPNSVGSSNPDQIHTGLLLGSGRKHVTIFGVPLEQTGFSTWFAGQPSSGAAEPCVSIMRQTIELNDISCEKQILAFICEIDL